MIYIGTTFSQGKLFYSQYFVILKKIQYNINKLCGSLNRGLTNYEEGGADFAKGKRIE